ncbi:MAG: hypothetical protein LBP76_07195 [Treponema sp.]|jgi:hypothetical protein|nr:hypothetical protein [Treponema sp.]
MPKRTQIICIHEGKKGRSIDPVFANAFLKTYNPEWMRPWKTTAARFIGYGGKTELRKAFPNELQSCAAAGGNTTLIVLADVDDLKNGDELKAEYWEESEAAGLPRELFEKVVFIFPKNRIENWVEFLNTGTTDENQEGPRVKELSTVRDAAKELAKFCRSGHAPGPLPPSLEWSCRNWRALVERMR